jgi:hypothetical protein
MGGEVTSGTRYLCPMPNCAWHHDEPDGQLPTTWPTIRIEDGIEAGIAALAEHAVIDRAGRVEVAIEQHLAAAHTSLDYVREIARLQHFVQQLRDLHHEGHGSIAMAGGGSMESDNVCPSCGLLWPCPTGELLAVHDGPEGPTP